LIGSYGVHDFDSDDEDYLFNYESSKPSYLNSN